MQTVREIPSLGLDVRIKIAYLDPETDEESMFYIDRLDRIEYDWATNYLMIDGFRNRNFENDAAIMQFMEKPNYIRGIWFDTKDKSQFPEILRKKLATISDEITKNNHYLPLLCHINDNGTSELCL